MEPQMNEVCFKNGKTYLNGSCIPYATDIEIKKHAGGPSCVKIEFLANFNSLDNDQLMKLDASKAASAISNKATNTETKKELEKIARQLEEQAAANITLANVLRTIK